MSDEKDDEPKVVDTNVEKDDDGNYTATVTKDDGSTSTGTSSPGAFEDGSAADAIENAKS